MPLPSDNYILSRDTSEIDRLRVQHEDMISCQGYYLHPSIHNSLPSSSPRIADVCTGSAIWLSEVASALPESTCHGFDISPKMFPSEDQRPDNMQLHTADIRTPFEERWIGFFDVVHVRLIEAAMKKETWAPVLRNLVTLLKPGGWIQWVEDDRPVSVRHAARPVAPLGAAKESLAGKGRFIPPQSSYLDRFNRLLMDNARSDDMMYGYMNLDTLMQDSKIGGLEQVSCDIYVIDREDDGGELRRRWAAMGIAAVWSMKQSLEANGEKLADITREELAEGFAKDIEMGGHFITRASVFTGRKKA